MGRDQRTEEPVSRDTGSVQPAFYLVGAPGTGKTKLAESLAERFDEKLAFYDEHDIGRYALGTVADYRVELSLAMSRLRMFEETQDMPVLYTHSLIDNLAYLTFGLTRYQADTVSVATVERAILTLGLVGALMTDSFRYDHVFFLQGNFDEDEDYEQFMIQNSLQMILDEYQINYSVINADENAEENIVPILDGYLNG